MSDTIPESTPQKQCIKCKEWKPLTPEYFPRESKRKDGFNVYCKVCVNAYNRSRHNRKSPLPETLPDGYKRCTKCKELKPCTKEYFYYNRHNDIFFAACKKCHDAYEKARKQTEEVKSRRLQLYLEHRDAKRAYQRAYYQLHRQEFSEMRRRHFSKHREWRVQYQKTHKEQKRANNRKRRALKKTSGTFTPQQIKQQYQRQKGKCYYCKKQVGKEYHIEHVIPISRGGSNDISNIVVSCPTCNMRKQGKLPHEWPEGGRLL